MRSPDAPQQFWTCGMHPQYISDHPGNCPICHMKLTPMHSHATGGESGPPMVVIDPAVVQNMGVRTAVATRGPLTVSVRTVGTLEAPEPGMHDISLKVSGWIEKLYANQDGQHVHAGEPLFDVYSPELQVAAAELVSAAQTAKGSGAESLASARRRLSLLDVPDAEIAAIEKSLVVPRTIQFASPASGAVVERQIVEGSAVQAGAKLMRIEDHSSLWLQLQVYEDQLEQVAVGETVNATVDAWPGRTFHGTITFIHPHLDHMSRTVTARAVLDNGGLLLRPGMYASAEIVTRPVDDAIQIPREAVIDTGARQLVFVAQPAGHFEPRDVRMGPLGSDGEVQILSGILPGETVVTSGQFLMDVESRTTEAIDKLRAGPMPTMPAADAGAMPMSATSQPEKTMLTLAYCPMKRAEWIQAGDTIANPYFGAAMPDCGSVERKVAMPTDLKVAAVLDAYLRVESKLAIDILDADAIAALRAAADAVEGPADLKSAAMAVTSAADIDTARIALKPLSAAIVRTLDPKAAPAAPPAMHMGDRS